MTTREQIEKLVVENLSGTENFLVEVKVNPGKIIVIIDHPKGVNIEDCVSTNRYLHSQLDDSGIFESHELEVSSAGMEEPLKILPQYKKRIGQNVSVLTYDGLRHSGKLLSADESFLELNEEKVIRIGKKKEIQNETNKIPFTEIKETKVIFSFDKII